MLTVSYAVEAVPRAERLERIVLLDEVANRFERGKPMKVVGAELIVAGPVPELTARWGFVGCLAEESGPGGSAQNRGR